MFQDPPTGRTTFEWADIVHLFHGQAVVLRAEMAIMLWKPAVLRKNRVGPTRPLVPARIHDAVHPESARSVAPSDSRVMEITGLEMKDCQNFKEAEIMGSALADRLREFACEMHVAPGELILNDDAPAQGAYIIDAGTVCISLVNDEGVAVWSETKN
jgi:hypothetical protein